LEDKTLPPHSSREIKVIAFVGSAGTGKSQRAQTLAREIKADYFIDDGLLVSKGYIRAGQSAKAERNQVSAIRRALFYREDHREEVRKILDTLESGTILILATSEGMARKIALRLELPVPGRIIRIEDVAKPQEIEDARKRRKLSKEHVIPVERSQVRRNFAGEIVRIFWGFLHREGTGDEHTVVRPAFSFGGTVKIETEVIEEMIRILCERTSQVVSVKEVKVKRDKESLTLKVKATLRIGDQSLVEVAKLIQKRLRNAVSFFTGMDVHGVDVLVEELSS
jgi:predicted nucleic acid-binding protein